MISSPEYPQSNCPNERAVRSAKRRKTKDRTDLNLNLLNIRNMHRDRILGSPPQRLRYLLIRRQLLKPAGKAAASIEAQVTKKGKAQKHCYDRTSKPLVPPTPDQVVRLKIHFSQNSFLGGRVGRKGI